MKLGKLSSELYVDFLFHYRHQILFIEEPVAGDRKLHASDY